MRIEEVIIEYITYRKALGEKFKSQTRALNTFCRFVGNDTEFELINENVISNYLYAPKSKATANSSVKYLILKGLYTWAIAREYVREIPLPQDIPSMPDHIVPYIYSKEELEKLFNSIMVYTKSCRYINPYVTQNILIFTYALGLRIHETVFLKLKDIDLDESLAIICESKFYKSRIVPFNWQVKTRLERYLEWRKIQGQPLDPETALFLDNRSNPITVDAIRGRFKRIREKSGIKRNDGAVYQPRIHDLRHTFAVNRLTTWYKEGKNVQELLPALSTYLGHKKLSHTSVYLTMTENLLKEANERFEKYASHE